MPARQLVLPFGVLARDWTRLRLHELPELAELAPELARDLRSKAVDQSWPRGAYRSERKLLAVVVVHGTPEQPFTTAELNSLCQRVIRPKIGAHRVADLLLRNGMLAIEPTVCRDERWVVQQVAAMPDNVRDDVEAWVRALRGRGKRPSPPVAWVAVRAYLHFAEPALYSWSANYENLRQVRRQDVQAAIAAHQGRSQHNVHSALRSLFRGLKRERRVFHDPARGVPGRYTNALPRSLPAERLRGLLDRCDDPRHLLTVALVAVHALSIEELIKLRLIDYNPARTTLAIRRGTHVFTVVLDPVVAGTLVTWMRTRVSRWPRTSNPHLFVTDCTALKEAPISRYGITAPFRLLGITAQQLRVDRILDEASHAGDPVQLMRVFGLGVGAAVRYVRAAHPERFRHEPTSP